MSRFHLVSGSGVGFIVCAMLVICVPKLVAQTPPAPPAPLAAEPVPPAPTAPATADLPQGPSLYDAPQVKNWSKLYLEGKLDQVIKSTEENLRSDSPHPFASYIWYTTHRARGDHRQAIEAVENQKLKSLLFPDVEIFDLHERIEYRKMLDKYPPETQEQTRSPWVLSHLVWAAENVVNNKVRLAYCKILLEKFPNNFDAVWWVYQIGLNDYRFYGTIKKMVGPDTALGKQLSGQLIHSLLRYPYGVKQLEQIHIADRWLKRYPNDARALRFKNINLAGISRNEEAAAAYARMTAIFPWYKETRNSYAVALLKLRRNAEAKKVIEHHVEIMSRPQEESAQLIAVYFAEASQKAGEKGLARTTLEAALKRWPDHSDLNHRMAELERASGRHTQAIPFARKALKADPKSDKKIIDLIAVIGASGQAGDVISTAKKHEKRIKFKTQYYYRILGKALESLKQTKQRIDLHKKSVAEFLDSDAVISRLADALGDDGQIEESLAMRRKVLEIDPDYGWSIDRLRHWSAELKDDAYASKIIEEYHQKHPWIAKLWSDKADAITGPDQLAKRIALWRKAAAANPGAGWPHENIITTLRDKNQWEATYKAIDEAIEQTKIGTADDRDVALFQRAITGVIHLRNQRLPRQMLEETSAYWQEYYKHGAHRSAYYKYSSEVLVALGRKEDAAKRYLRAVQLNPGFAHPNKLLWYFSNASKGGWMELKRYADQDPYDEGRLWSVANMHVKYGGSGIVAVRYLNLRKERTGKESTAIMAMAMDQLGDSVTRFRNYETAGSISKSDRYISWYEGVRARAQKPSARLQMDPQKYLWITTYPDGSVVKRQVHPVSGRPVLYQIGAAYVTAQYDVAGENLRRMETSGGQWLKLEYDAENRIKKMSQSSGKILTFKYNDIGKPILISIEGVGAIDVEYDAQGEIKKISSKAGHKMALQVTQAFQSLLRLTKSFEKFGSSTLPNLPYVDKEHDRLRSALRKANKQEEFNEARLAYVTYLVAHVADKASYQDQAMGHLKTMIRDSSRGSETANVASGVESVKQYHQLMRKVRVNGLSADDWVQWNHTVDWVETVATTAGQAQEPARQVLKAIKGNPLELLQDATWLLKSDLVNPGYWRRFVNDSILPPQLVRTARIQVIMTRRNGHFVIGTSKGLCVMRRGYWEWLAFDPANGRFSSRVEPSEADVTSNIHALAETADGALWVGTASGLFRIEGDDYEGKARRWVTTDDGLPTASINHLAVYKNGVAIGTSKGLFIAQKDRITPADETLKSEIQFIRTIQLPGDKKPGVLVGTKDGLFIVSPKKKEKPIKVVAGQVEDALVFLEQASVYFLRGGVVYRVSLSDLKSDQRGEPRPLRDQRGILKTNRVNGLSLITISGGNDRALAVLTDRGVSIHRNAHFEHLDMPKLLSTRQAGVYAMNTLGKSTIFHTTEGIYFHERGQINADSNGRVYDLLSVEAQGITFVARGDRLEWIDHRHIDQGARVYGRINARHLALDSKNRLIANDGYTILRYEIGSTRAHELFTTSGQTTKGDYNRGPVRDLLVASDDTIWVTAGPSLFRWKEGMKEAEEFSYFKDSKRFPSKTHMVSRVVETIDKRIWVVCSDEGHLNYEGTALGGGLLEWTGKDFKRSDLPEESGYWFITGYTPIDKNTAIAGTLNGFVRHKKSHFTSYYSTNEPSYRKLTQVHPKTFLGTKGAKIGKDTWLFGTASGLVAYREGTWFVPERLNWQLPDQHLSLYGSRDVHAVATDSRGRIYAGTDRGLLIYDSGGAESTDFLTFNRVPEGAMQAAELGKLERLAQIFIKSAKVDSKTGKQIIEITQMRQEIEKLRTSADPGVALKPPAGTGDQTQQGQPKTDSRDEIEKQLAARERRYRSMLARLERNNYGLYQMLSLKPMDLVAARKRLSPGQVIVQYIPEDKKLKIHLVSRNQFKLVEVEISKKELLGRAQIVAQSLNPAKGAKAALRIEKSQDLIKELAWLYDQLLKPVEHDLAGYTHIWITPVDKLTYLPFGALVRTLEPRPEYAIERFNLGYMPSIYHLELMLRDVPSLSEETLVMADPDGTLKAGRDEAKYIHGVLKSQTPLQVGQDATAENFEKFGANSRIIHLATHGKLDAMRPERSYLLMANNQRLSVLDIQGFDLRETDLAVLSACQTALGGEGLEFSTLARAFAHAGVPTIIATLWSVDDKASSELMKQFYSGYVKMEEPDTFTALRNAKIKMLKQSKYREDPQKWAGYIVIGKP